MVFKTWYLNEHINKSFCLGTDYTYFLSKKKQ